MNRYSWQGGQRSEVSEITTNTLLRSPLTREWYPWPFDPWGISTIMCTTPFYQCDQNQMFCIFGMKVEPVKLEEYWRIISQLMTIDLLPPWRKTHRLISVDVLCVFVFCFVTTALLFFCCWFCFWFFNRDFSFFYWLCECRRCCPVRQP